MQYFLQEDLLLVEAWGGNTSSGGVQLRNILQKGESCFCLERSSTPEASLEGGQAEAGQDDQCQGPGAGSLDRWIVLSEWVWPDYNENRVPVLGYTLLLLKTLTIMCSF